MNLARLGDGDAVVVTELHAVLARAAGPLAGDELGLGLGGGHSRGEGSGEGDGDDREELHFGV